MYKECKDFYQRIEYFVKHNRSDRDRRQRHDPPPGHEQRVSAERRKSEPFLKSLPQQACAGRYPAETTLIEFITACRHAIPLDDTLTVTISVSRKTP